nr:hypothetical protein CFP56_00781 [Quercus suber]
MHPVCRSSSPVACADCSPVRPAYPPLPTSAIYILYLTRCASVHVMAPVHARPTLPLAHRPSSPHQSIAEALKHDMALDWPSQLFPDQQPNVLLTRLQRSVARSKPAKHSEYRLLITAQGTSTLSPNTYERRVAAELRIFQAFQSVHPLDPHSHAPLISPHHSIYLGEKRSRNPKWFTSATAQSRAYPSDNTSSLTTWRSLATETGGLLKSFWRDLQHLHHTPRTSALAH